MREIKFRGMSVHNGKWIYGYVHVIDTIDHGYTGIAIQQQNGKSRPFSVTVDKKSVGQYTGICDKNGVEIYDGDILEDEKGYGEVVWVAEQCAFLCYTKTSPAFFYLEGDSSLKKTIVVGNIHENPELLEDQQ